MESQPIADQDRRIVVLIYILQFIGLVSAGIASIIAVVIAHVKSGSVSAEWQSHVSYQIRTFWYGVLITFVGAVLTIVLIGWLILLWWWIWTLVRTVKGFLAANEGRPIENPETLLW